MKNTMVLTRSLLMGFLIISVCFYSIRSNAGVALGATRVIYPAGQKQVQLSVNNNEGKSTYLIQSWIENADGVKDGQFVTTPPLFALQGKKENILRIIDATHQELPQNRESLFWLNVKAIPSMDKSRLHDNTLQLAITSRIKLFYRPAGLAMPPDNAAEKLIFHRNAQKLILKNPTPYFLTVTDLRAGNHKLENTMAPPMGESSVPLPANAGTTITYRMINDYGALTPAYTAKIR